MEYSLVGSLRKDSFIPSVPGIRGICSTTSSSGAAPVLDCKRWNNTDHKHFPKSIQISRKQQLLMSTTSTTRLVAAISRGSENDEIMVNPAADVHDVYPFEAEEASNTPLTSLLHNLDAFKRFICLHGLVATIYVVGINQLADIEIDKVNKPYRPLASGDFSYTTGSIITLFCATTSFLIGWKVGSLPLMCALTNLFVVGTVYSLDVPYLRWKKHAFLAAICIFSLRTPTPLAYYMHMQTFVLRRPAIFPKTLLFMLTFMCFFSIGLALVKDIPDIDGDKKHGVRSFAIQVGREKVFNICKALFQTPYLIAILVGLTCSQNWSRFITVGAHMVLGSLVWNRANSIDLRNTVSTGTFYRLMWKLISLECFLIPLMR